MRTIFLSGVIATAAFLQSAQTAWSQSQVIPDEPVPADTVLRLLELFNVSDVQQLRGNQLPENLPVQIPLPENATVLVSTEFYVGGFDTNSLYHIVLDVPQSPEALADLYQEQLEASGWLPSPQPHAGNGGFVANAVLPYDIILFCQNVEQQALKVSITPQGNRVSGLAVSLLPVSEVNDGFSWGDGTCESRPLPPEGQPFENIPMPLLNPPPEASVKVGGTTLTGSENHSQGATAATIESELSAAVIAQHYGNEWEEAGWQLVSSNDSNNKIESLWILEDENGMSWQGTLTVEPSENAPRRYTAAKYNVGAIVESL
ncbi:MAG: hypothetical protein ACFBSF_19700 [Leptolyngbyaceae cyanobacterium]